MVPASADFVHDSHVHHPAMLLSVVVHGAVQSIRGQDVAGKCAQSRLSFAVLGEHLFKGGRPACQDASGLPVKVMIITQAAVNPSPQSALQHALSCRVWAGNMHASRPPANMMACTGSSATCLGFVGTSTACQHGSGASKAPKLLAMMTCLLTRCASAGAVSARPPLQSYGVQPGKPECSVCRTEVSALLLGSRI